RTVSAMRRIEYAKARPPRRLENFRHIGNTRVCFCNDLEAVPHLSSLGNEIVEGIDHQKCSQLLVVCEICHGLSPGRITVVATVARNGLFAGVALNNAADAARLPETSYRSMVIFGMA